MSAAPETADAQRVHGASPHPRGRSAVRYDAPRQRAARVGGGRRRVLRLFHRGRCGQASRQARAGAVEPAGGAAVAAGRADACWGTGRVAVHSGDAGAGAEDRGPAGEGRGGDAAAGRKQW